MTPRFNPRKAAWVERVPASVNGIPSTRLIFIFRAIGCAHALRPDGGCTPCGFLSMSTAGCPVASEDLIAQFDEAFAQPGILDNVTEVNLYNSGSFFADREIPPDVRDHVLTYVGQAGLRRVLVESRPEHVSADKLRIAKHLLGACELDVGIGLESANDHVRETLINKGFSLDEFERSVQIIGQSGACLLAYVLIKPPGLSEAESIADAVESARYVFETAKKHRVNARVALQPSFVAPGTKVERDFLAGHYAPPNLWSVVSVVRQAHPFGELLVGLSDEGLEPRRMPSGCDSCTNELRAALTEYNRTRNLDALNKVQCNCPQAGLHASQLGPDYATAESRNASEKR